MGPKKDQGKFKRSKIQKLKANKGACFVCGKCGHYARDCRFKKKPNQEEKVNSVKDNDEIIAVVSEINVVQGKVLGWWYDTCATVHVCYDKSMFKTYHEVNDGQEIQMGNEGLSKVLSKGTI